MLEWTLKNGDDELRKDIERLKEEFDEWFNLYWSKRVTREQMLSENSPVQRVYFKMIKTFDEIKKEYPDEITCECSSCGKYVDKWVVGNDNYKYSEYPDIDLCEECVDKLKKMFSGSEKDE